MTPPGTPPLFSSGGTTPPHPPLGGRARPPVPPKPPVGYTVGGMAKGAGMLAPALATMLCVLTTDAEVSPAELDAALRSATPVTFDRLDTEGAEKMISIEVVGAASESDALTVGRAVARNNLLKCAITGEDPNWGRVLAAVGTTDAAFEPDRLNVAINGVWVCRHGAAGDERSKVDLRPKDVTITVDLSAGPHSAVILTTDLTAAYVHENSAYST